MQGNVFNIQRFSINDGPGIRTTLFLKGCNLRCQWCHNPESYKSKREIQYFEQMCTHCGACIEACQQKAIYRNEAGEKVFDRSLCTRCGACVEACPSEALVFVGDLMETDEVMHRILKDADYYKNSGGGLTISGGEPLLQKDFVKEIFAKTKRLGIHNALDTAADVEWSVIEEVLPFIDLVLLDIKVMDHEVHFRHTGVYNHKILQNAKKLAEEDIDIIVRIPVIPGVNATEDNMNQTAEFLSGFKRLVRVELLPYHSLGVEKHNTLGAETQGVEFKEPEDEAMKQFAACFEKHQMNVQIS